MKKIDKAGASIQSASFTSAFLQCISEIPKAFAHSKPFNSQACPQIKTVTAENGKSKRILKTKRFGLPPLSLIAILANPAWAADPVGEDIATPIGSTVNGTVPPRVLSAGDIVTVSGYTTPALYSLGTGAGGAANSIIVNGGGIQAINFAGGGLGVVTANNGGFVNLGTGSIIQTQGTGSPVGIIGATGIFSRNQATGSLVQAVVARDVTVSASSDKPYGIYAHTDSQITLTGLTTVNTFSNGTQGWGLVTNERGVITAENVNISMGDIGGTFGDFQAGISAWNGSSTIVTGDAVVVIGGKDSVGAHSQYASSNVTLNNISGQVVGNVLDAAGFSAVDGGSVTVNGHAGLAIAAATDAFGLHVMDNGNIDIAGSADLNIGGANAYGLRSTEGGTISVNNSTMLLTGSSSAAAILSSAAAGGTLSTFNVSNSTINSRGDGIVVDGGTADVNLSNTALNNRSQLAINVAGAVASTLNLDANNSTFNGRAVTTAGNTANVTLHNGSRWSMTGDSVVTNLTNSASEINFSAPSGGVFKTLTTDNYVGANGIIGLHTYLDVDGSPSDLLVINGGTATGSTGLRIFNAGGGGALTTGNGIQVVSAIAGGTTATNAFRLAAPAVAGPYEYDLNRGATDGSDAESWYLRSRENDCTQLAAPCPPGPYIRPEVSLYAAIAPTALQYGNTLLDTLNERIGRSEGPPLGGSSGIGGSADNDQRNNNIWSRLIGMRGSRDGDSVGIYGEGPKYDYRFYGMQVGTDLWRNKDEKGNRDQAGVYGAIGYAKTDVTHFDRTNAGADRFTGYSVGGYWTRFGPEDGYVDVITQMTWYDIKSDSERDLPDLKTSGLGLAASVEGGKPFRLQNNWIVEPQAQLVYQWIDLDDANDVGANVRFSDVESLQARLGVRIAKDAKGPEEKIGGGVRFSVWHEFQGDPKTEISTADGYLPFRSNSGGSWWEIKAGLTSKMQTRNAYLFGNIGYQKTFDGDAYAWDGKIGMRFDW